MSRPNWFSNDCENMISLDHFKHWLQQQDPATTYSYLDHNNCLVARYLKAFGLEPTVYGWNGYAFLSDGTKVWFGIPDELERVAVNHDHRTYGEVLAALG